MKMKQMMVLGMTTMMMAYPSLTVTAAQTPLQGANNFNLALEKAGRMQTTGQPGNMTGGVQFNGNSLIAGQLQQGGDIGAGGMNSNVTYESEPSEIVTSTVVNTAQNLVADEANATTIAMSSENSQVKIDTAGTYIITGSCADGNITVKKGTTGVVLVLRDLDLTCTSGATLSCNKNSEVKIIVDGSVKLTDAENPADENSTDADVADAFDGAAIKAKDGSNVYLTGTGTLTIDASSCKNGIKVGDESTPSFVIDGDLTLDINAANDGINAGYDLTILSGNLNITAGDDAIHADRILTIGSEDGSGPSINIRSSYEGLEGSVVNLFGGTGTIRSSDDAVNAANSDETYAGEMAYSINVTGGKWTINAQGDGLDSNGNVNLTGGSTTINSASKGGEAGIDYDGKLYVAEGTLNNASGVAGPDGMPGGMQGQPRQTQQQGQPGQQMNGKMQQPGQMQQNGEMSGQPGQAQQGAQMPQNDRNMQQSQPGNGMPQGQPGGDMPQGQPGGMQNQPVQTQVQQQIWQGSMNGQPGGMPRR